jgi:hypothetical protein
MRPAFYHLAIGLLIVSTLCSRAAESGGPLSYEYGGHVKSRVSVEYFPEGSLFRDYADSSASDLNSNLRLKFKGDRDPWSFTVDGQVIALYGDTVEFSRELFSDVQGLEFLSNRLPNDDRRWWDLTNIARDSGNSAVINRLDRLAVGYSGDRLSLNFGRQAISWGNGLFYSPMDIVNPFDPAQVDTEYKSGDDMLYAQLLQDNGNDLEGSVVIRRSLITEEPESDQSTAALKYHGFIELVEYDLLIAEHYGEPLFGIGGSVDLGGALWRGDLVLSDTEFDGVVTQFVANSSYSWVWSERNFSGSVEYYYNGFGQNDGCYSSECLASNVELVRQFGRGQLYTLGRHYLAASMSMEVTPLFNLTPNVFWNLSDHSALLQIVTRNSLGDNLVLLGAATLPLGPDGTEYGGIPADNQNRYFSRDWGLFMQLGWYF